MTEPGESRAVGGPWWWERRRSAALDVALGAVSSGECAFQGVEFAAEAGVPTAAGVVLGVVAGATLVLRRRWPIAVVLVAVAVSPAEMGLLLGIVGLYSLAVSDVPRRITVLLTGMTAVAVVISTLIRLQQGVGRDPAFDPPAWFIPLVSVALSLGVTAPPVLLGLYLRARRRLVESLRERADGLERELALLADRAEERAEWARNEERTRIAREMHDVVAHRVSLMVVHSAALQAVALKDPEKASKNAALVGDMGRQALTELRTMLGVLRSQQQAPGNPAKPEHPLKPGQPEKPGGGGPARLAEFAVAVAGSVRGGGRERGGSVPVAAVEEKVVAEGPRLGELEALVGQSRTAGMAVELSVEGESSGGYAAGVEQTAFRVVQEALTNVHKHAPGARTRVRLAHRAAEVAVQVENEPSVAGDGAQDAGLPSGGNGLVGMKERVVALGGGFVSGPTDAGGFRVSAVIPAGRARVEGAAGADRARTGG
ncbi:MAG: sensor histidine kinase [Streptomyces sp.]|uniref:sensor histidine kinase n=1 Tax=Streptomyces sp. TaxID=1931 RepID=UPI003D6C4EC6